MALEDRPQVHARRTPDTNEIRVRPAKSQPADGGSLVVISGGRLGERVEFHDVPVVIGRSPEADFEIEHPSVSRFHCTVWQEGRRFRIRDLGSKNGTLVDGRKVTDSELNDGDLVTLGEVALKFVPAGGIEAKYHEEIHRLATVDSLTQLQNRRVFREAVDAAFAAAQLGGDPVALAIVDVDDFKKVNDTYGHGAGDDALRSIATALRDMLRTGDVAGRLGGDEFAVLLPATSESEALHWCEVVRGLVEGLGFEWARRGFRITVSIGLASFRRGMTDGSELMEAADLALGRAKLAGRNGVEVATARRATPPARRRATRSSDAPEKTLASGANC